MLSRPLSIDTKLQHARQPRRPTIRTSAARDDSFLAAFSARVLANPRYGDFSLG
jgi:hypothetical protein